jgi:hypothetical protein
MFSKTLNEQNIRRQALPRETLGLFGAILASRSQTFALPRLLQAATCASRPVKLPHTRGGIKASWVMSWSSKGNAPSKKGQPPRAGLNQIVLDGTSFFFSFARDKPIIVLSLPLMGSQQPSDGLFSPMEVRANHLPMCIGPTGTCPSGMVMHIKKFTLNGLISHRDHSNVNHSSSLILSNICIKPLIYHSIAQKYYKDLQYKAEEKDKIPYWSSVKGCGQGMSRHTGRVKDKDAWYYLWVLF